MPSLRTNQNGFTVVEGILLLVIVVSISAIGFLVYQRQSNAKYNKEADAAYEEYTNEASKDYEAYRKQSQ